MPSHDLEVSAVWEPYLLSGFPQCGGRISSNYPSSTNEYIDSISNSYVAPNWNHWSNNPGMIFDGSTYPGINLNRDYLTVNITIKLKSGKYFRPTYIYLGGPGYDHCCIGSVQIYGVRDDGSQVWLAGTRSLRTGHQNGNHFVNISTAEYFNTFLAVYGTPDFVEADGTEMKMDGYLQEK